MTSEERHEARYQRRKAKRLQKAAPICGKTFDEVFTYRNLYDAAKDCCKGVRWKSSTINFEANLVCEVQKLYQQLHNGTYKFEGFKNFQTIEHGKLRTINALKIHDRAVQKCYCDQVMTEAYARSFIYDNSASLPGKGMDMTLMRMKNHLREHYREFGTEGGIYQFDLKNYFGSIPHEGAKDRLRLHIWDEKLQALGCQLIDDFQMMSNATCEDGIWRGVGLGSQVSQNIALDFASPIDHFIKDKLGFKHYARYMDDGYVICESIERLEQLHKQLVVFARSVGIELNEKKCRITPFRNHGFYFLKLRFQLEESGKVSMRLGRKSIYAIRRKLYTFRQWVDEGIFSPEDCFTSYQSWRSHARRCNSYRTLRAMDKLFVSLFYDELAVIRNPFKCLLKPTYIEGFGWAYTLSSSDGHPLPHASKSNKTENYSRAARAYASLREVRKGVAI